jgi:hypothetical protein
MSRAATVPMVWADNDTQGSMKHCAACGRKLQGKPQMVEVIDGGAQVGTPDLEWDTTDAGYMGLFPVGPTCAKKHFRGFVQ